MSDTDRIYPCRECGEMRSKNEGGTTFTVCDACWDKAYAPKHAPDRDATIACLEKERDELRAEVVKARSTLLNEANKRCELEDEVERRKANEAELNERQRQEWARAEKAEAEVERLRAANAHLVKFHNEQGRSKTDALIRVERAEAALAAALAMVLAVKEATPDRTLGSIKVHGTGPGAPCLGYLQDVAERALLAAHPTEPSDTKPREPGCRCHWEEGDSSCPVHGIEEPSK